MIKTKIQKWFETGRELLGSLLFPSRCPICDEILEPEEIKKGIHLACESKLFPIYGAVCMHCGRPIQTQEFCYECMRQGYHKKSNITQAKSLFIYKGLIKQTMYRFKYSNKREYAEYFADIAMKNLSAWIKQHQIKQHPIEAIVPVPMYRKKQRLRGYNQAEVFARALSKRMQIPVDTSLVKRIKDTAPQKGLNAAARANNLKNAFQKGEFVVQYKCVLVVDDIYTTGNTAEAVARELRENGARQVYLLTVCIGEDV